MKVLLHTCCAPCLTGSLLYLEDCSGYSGMDFYWYNPNIHLYTEYESRKKSLIDFCEKSKYNIVVNDYYGLREFIKNTACNSDSRCSYCYEVRLEQTAKYAAENGYEAFSTTLFISPYQKHDLIERAGVESAEKYGLQFIRWNLKEPSVLIEKYREGQRKARENGIYMQKYCGCVYSEEERYKK